MRNGIGCRTIQRCLRSDYGVNALRKSVENYVCRIRRGGGPGTRALRGYSMSKALPLPKTSILKRPAASFHLAPPMDDGATDAAEGSIIAKRNCFQGFDLLSHTDAICLMMRDGMGYRAIRTRLRNEHGIDVAAKSVQNYVLRLNRGNAAAIRARWRLARGKPRGNLSEHGDAIRALVHSGLSATAIWTRLRAERGVDVSYSSFANYVRQFKRGLVKRSFSCAELLEHEDDIRALVASGLGYRSIRTRLRLEYGVFVSPSTMAACVARLLRSSFATLPPSLMDYEEVIRAHLEHGLGARAITKRLRAEHGVDVSCRTMQIYYHSWWARLLTNTVKSTF